MPRFRPLRLVLTVCLARFYRGLGSRGGARPGAPLKPDVPGTAINHRLILKDGPRKYEIVATGCATFPWSAAANCGCNLERSP